MAFPLAATPPPIPANPLRALLALVLGPGGVLLLLLGLAVLAAAAGFPVPGAVAALDPGRPGSLPDLWSVALLTLAAAAPAAAWAAGRPRGILPLAMLPLSLLLAEGGDLAARLAQVIAAAGDATVPAGPAKLAAGGAVAVLVAGSALPAWRRFAAARPTFGWTLALGAVLGAAASLGLDLAGGQVPGAGAWHGVRLVPALEETVELGLHSLAAAATFEALLAR